MIGQRVAMYTRLSRQRLAAGAKHGDQIGYIGWQGHGNLGDDIMFETARGLLAPHTILPYESTIIERRMAHLRLSGPPYFRSVLLGGGTLISSYYLTPVLDVLDQGIPVWACGTGVGSSGFEEGPHPDISPWRAVLPRLRKIGVRGPLSKRRLDALGAENVQVVGDLALSCAQHEPTPVSPVPCIAVNLALPGQKEVWDHGVYACVEALCEALRALAARGWTLVPFAMDTRDMEVMRELLGDVARERLVINVPRSKDELLHLIGPCAFAVTVRLHGAILATCAGVPPVLVRYRDKCLDFMESMDLAEWCLDPATATADDIGEKILLLEAACGSLRQGIIDRAQTWKKIQAAFIESERSTILA